jgi:hypothetical protein
LIDRHHDDWQARLSRCDVITSEVIWESDRIQRQKASEDGEEGYHGCLVATHKELVKARVSSQETRVG